MRSKLLLCLLTVACGCCAFPAQQPAFQQQPYGQAPGNLGQAPAGYGPAPSTYQPPGNYGQATPSDTLRRQQASASQWDPYADIDAGPQIESSRPREFSRPSSEPIRARGFRDTRWPF